MSDTKYTENHEWIRLEEGGIAVVGITDHAQQQLGDLVHIEMPSVGSTVARHETCAVIESVKAAGDLYSPASGTVVEINAALADAPEKANEDAMGEGWFFKLELSDPAELAELMDEAAYQASLD